MPQNSPKITVNRSNAKSPRQVIPGIYAFPPNRDTLGATSYLIVDKSGNILLDCPAWNEISQDFLKSVGGISRLIISHRGGIGKNVLPLQQALNCQVVVQEQEAYLLPEVEVIAFGDRLTISSDLEMIWTPGHSPGSSCLYWQQHGGVIFTGRHLLPKSPTEIVPLRTAKTFHWWRQLDSIAKLRDRFSAETLSLILPGANTGYLRGTGYIADGYQKLQDLDLAALRSTKVL